jgi:1-deoxy-D-xylulose-5-phosphate reductoisomerase
MPKAIAIFGSTGSIGVNTLNIVRSNPEKLKVKILVANSNVDLIVKQALEFLPEFICLVNKAMYEKLQQLLNHINIKVLSGIEGANKLAEIKVDLTVMSIVGAAAIIPCINAIKAGNNIAMANKECLVCAGSLIMQLAAKHNVKIIPMDSEHTGLYQIFDFNKPSLVKDVVLTASGGPFRNFTKEQMQSVTKQQALKHPNWSMGAKITIDSSTLVNKCLEVIEACYLFSLKANQVKVIVHPESIIHGLVNYQDGSVLAQLSVPDMQVPISYALFYPDRAILNEFNNFDLSDIGKLNFYKPDDNKFRSLYLLKSILKSLDTNYPLIFNVANEVAVEAFLKDKISFNQIIQVIEAMLNKIASRPLHSIEDTLDEIKLVSEKTHNYIRAI